MTTRCRATGRSRSAVRGRCLPTSSTNFGRAATGWPTCSFLWRLVDLVEVKNQAIYGGFGLQAAGLYDRVDLVPDGEVYQCPAIPGRPDATRHHDARRGIAEQLGHLAVARPTDRLGLDPRRGPVPLSRRQPRRPFAAHHSAACDG